MNWLIVRAGLAEKYGAYIDGHVMGMESVTKYTQQIKAENSRLLDALEDIEILASMNQHDATELIIDKASQARVGELNGQRQA